MTGRLISQVEFTNLFVIIVRKDLVRYHNLGRRPIIGIVAPRCVTLSALCRVDRRLRLIRDNPAHLTNIDHCRLVVHVL